MTLPQSAVPRAALVAIDGVPGWFRLLTVVAVCALAAAAIRRTAGLGNGRDELVAAARAAVQLAVVGTIITAVLGSWGLTAAFAAVMAGVASWTADSRMKLSQRWWTLLPIVSGSLPLTALLVASGLLPATPIAVIPVAGIFIGNAMTTTTLAGRRALESLTERRGEYEAALSLGLLDRDARLLVAQEAAALSLVPGLDQTRTVGLVTLPGAFVGTLLGGATPMEAAALQLIVLVGLLLVQSIAAAIMLELVVRDVVRR